MVEQHRVGPADGQLGQLGDLVRLGQQDHRQLARLGDGVERLQQVVQRAPAPLGVGQDQVESPLGQQPSQLGHAGSGPRVGPRRAEQAADQLPVAGPAAMDSRTSGRAPGSSIVQPSRGLARIGPAEGGPWSGSPPRMPRSWVSGLADVDAPRGHPDTRGIGRRGRPSRLRVTPIALRRPRSSSNDLISTRVVGR